MPFEMEHRSFLLIGVPTSNILALTTFLPTHYFFSVAGAGNRRITREDNRHVMHGPFYTTNICTPGPRARRVFSDEANIACTQEEYMLRAVKTVLVLVCPLPPSEPSPGMS